FDSAPEIGSIGRAADLAIALLRPDWGPIVGGGPGMGRYQSFGHLFALAGETGYRLDRHPTMSRHPATPMHEADLVRHFAALGLPAMASIAWPELDEALEVAWQRTASQLPPAILLDVLDDTHLSAIGG